MDQNNKNMEILRRLASKVADIASLPVQQEKKRMWSKLNMLEDTKPMIWINEISWNEMDVDDELKLCTTGEFNQYYETELRRIIYQWEHMRADMVVENYIECPLYIRNTGIGLSPIVHEAVTDPESDIKGQSFEQCLITEDDIYKIHDPQIIYDRQKNESNLQYTKEIFDGILEVRMGAPSRHDFKLEIIDEYFQLRGIEQAMIDLVLEPEFVHKSLERLYNAMLSKVKQYEELNLLKLNNGNYRIGSGGIGYTDELPVNGYDPDRVRTIDMWGCAQDQIFSQVSPAMHDEFAIRYVLPWMQMFGLTYYGCCEPLHKKVNILKKIPNLRKISMSPWVNENEAIDSVGSSYVYSYKPSPAIFATDWEPDRIRKGLSDFLKRARNRGCIVEIILKDISTVQYKPHHLWEWAVIAAEVAENF
jgi:hypothetical protein